MSYQMVINKSKFNRYLKYKEDYGIYFFFIPLAHTTVNLTNA